MEAIVTGDGNTGESLPSIGMRCNDLKKRSMMFGQTAWSIHSQ